jgi:hypothetical protein
MEIEIFSLCDYSQDFQGKLIIVGTFDTIFGVNFPLVFPACSVAARLRFHKGEEGQHNIRITFVDSNGVEIVPSINGDLNVQMPPDLDSSTFNLSITIGQLQFDNIGKYYVQFYIDGEQKRSLPLYVRRRT